jgi:membrane associated rhomboid family serine protease
MSQISNSNPKIKSDFYLFYDVIKDILLYTLMLIPNFIGLILTLFSSNSEKKDEYIKKIISEPFVIIEKFFTWFFQARWTAYLIIFLIMIFLLQVMFLNSMELINIFKSHPEHTFSIYIFSNITSLFLHGNITHILSNILSLLVFGRIVERHFGIKIIWIFLLCGFAANLLSNLLSFYFGNYYYSLGASSGIAGLIILAILLEPFAFSVVFLLPLPIFILGWTLIYMDLIGITNPSQINHQVHLIGYGALIIALFMLEINQRKKIYLGLALNTSLIIILIIISYFFNIKEIVGLI